MDSSSINRTLVVELLVATFHGCDSEGELTYPVEAAFTQLTITESEPVHRTLWLQMIHGIDLKKTRSRLISSARRAGYKIEPDSIVVRNSREFITQYGR